MVSIFLVLYGIGSYIAFLASFLYLIAFVGNLPVPKTIDSGAPAGLLANLVIDVILMSVFALQHSIMARKGFKQWWTRLVPKAAERSTYVLAASAALAPLSWQWRPLAEPLIWQVDGAVATLAIQTAFLFGWGLLLLSSFLINHFEWFELSQVWCGATGRAPKTQAFRTPALYRQVRHPLYLGFIIGAWATPSMSLGHLLFAGGMTAYILVGIGFEERDLVRQFGDRYQQYQERLGMLISRFNKKSASDQAIE